MRPFLEAIEASNRDPGAKYARRGEGWAYIAEVLGVSRVTLNQWRESFFPGWVMPTLVRHTGIRGEAVADELGRALEVPVHFVVAMVADCAREPVAGGWCRLMASRALGVSPGDVLLLWDACKERPDGVLEGQAVLL